LLVSVIFGGIRAGIFTAIESASIAVVYAVLVTALIYRKLTVRNFVEACSGAVRTTGLIV
jgi:TRAP-type C4-dicarboxylate transport system permease large subunit